jgi:integrase
MKVHKISGWYKWAFSKQRTGVYLIRRYRIIDGKRHWQTYPKAKYQNFNQDEIEALLRRLNASLEIAQRESIAKYDFDHAYINTSILNKFEDNLKTKATNSEHINKLMTTLKDFTLKYFVHKMQLPDPNFWKRNEAGFGQFLLNQKISPDYIRRIIQTANRFVKFLHEQYPEEVRLFRLESVSNSVMKSKSLEGKNVDRKKFITEPEFNLICTKVNKRIVPAIKLAYFFGLRLSEVLGLNQDDVYQESLQLQRQLTKVQPIKHFKPLKSKEKRDVPYWFCTPEDTFQLIADLEVMHPDTLGHMFEKEMKKMNLPFQFHDFRRTFITRALRTHHYLDVKLAAGHSDLETTNKYIQDDRELQRKKFKPKLSVLEKI